MQSTGSMTGIVGVILAGGLSRRMGGEAKALMPLAGRPMIAHAIDRICPYVDACILNVNGDASAFAQFGLPIVADAFGDYAGPLAGLLSGMLWAAEHHPTRATSSPPLVTRRSSRRIMSTRWPRRPVAIAQPSSSRHRADATTSPAVFGPWRWRTISPPSSPPGSAASRRWIEQNPNKTVTFPFVDDGQSGFDPFFNVNTPEDLAIAEDFVRERRP